MKKFTFVTSAITMCTLCPAIAEPSHTSNSFPNDELMQEDYTYQNQANYTNMGIYEGDITANAEYDDILYQIAAGTYLAAGQTTASTCTAGNFCIGVTDATYNAQSNQGLTSCSTVGDTTYTQSAAGASADTDCYKACTTANVAHSATVTGNNYYGDGEDTCSATSCDSGYHVQSSGVDVQTAVGTDLGSSFIGVDNSGDATKAEYVDEDGEFDHTYHATYAVGYYGLSTSDHNSFAVEYDDVGMIRGHGRCSTQQGYRDTVNNISGNYDYNNPSTASSITDETGEEGAKYCWCQVDGFTPTGGALQNVQSSWVYMGVGFAYHSWSASEYCANNCSYYCAMHLYLIEDYPYDANSIEFRSTLLGSIQSGGGLATCAANTINITWTDASAADIAANNAATATYDGDIRTPAAATDKTNIGKRFKGWKFSKPTPVQQGN